MKHDYFKNWSHDMAYILGFIMADGSIRHKNYCKVGGYSVAINIHLKDKNILDYIKNEIKTKANVNIYKWTGSDNIYREQASLVISSKELVEDLMNLGVIPQKTGKEIFPIMPKEFEIDFIRGYFDGDGCILISKQKQKDKIYPTYCFKITCANKFFLDICKSKINNLGGNVRFHGSNCYVWCACSKKDIIKIRNLFYEGHSRFTMERKKQIFFEIGNI